MQDTGHETQLYQCTKCGSVYEYDGLGKYPDKQKVFCRTCHGEIYEISKEK